MAINAEPHLTFKQLPPEKRQRFIDSAIGEFGRQPYRTASISAIVADLGIAKGSFYQYFENKAGLYVWLIRQMGEAKVRYLDQVEELSFVGLVRASFVAGLTFWNEHPHWAQFAGQLLQPTGETEIDEYLDGLRRVGVAWWEERLSSAQAEGSIRADFDPKIVAPLLNAMLSTGMSDVYRSALGADDQVGIDTTTVMALADTAVDLLARGLEHN